MATPLLYSWSMIQFEVYPVNVSEVDHQTATDWAKKEIAGAAIYREWVGENDEEISLRGKIFPMMRLWNQAGAANGDSAKATLEVLDGCRMNGIAGLLIRGDGWRLGWYVIEKLSRAHHHLGPDGYGQQVDFEVMFARVPVPDASTQFTTVWSNLLMA